MVFLYYHKNIDTKIETKRKTNLKKYEKIFIYFCHDYHDNGECKCSDS